MRATSLWACSDWRRTPVICACESRARVRRVSSQHTTSALANAWHGPVGQVAQITDGRRDEHQGSGRRGPIHGEGLTEEGSRRRAHRGSCSSRRSPTRRPHRSKAPACASTTVRQRGAGSASCATERARRWRARTCRCPRRRHPGRTASPGCAPTWCGEGRTPRRIPTSRAARWRARVRAGHFGVGQHGAVAHQPRRSRHRRPASVAHRATTPLVHGNPGPLDVEADLEHVTVGDLVVLALRAGCGPTTSPSPTSRSRAARPNG